MSAPISYVYFSSLFMIRVLLMKCRDKENWHKYSGSLESEQSKEIVQCGPCIDCAMSLELWALSVELHLSFESCLLPQSSIIIFT